MKAIKLAAAIWLALLAMGVGFQFIPWVAAAEPGVQRSGTVMLPDEQAAGDVSFPPGRGYFGGGAGFGSANNGIGAGVNYAGDLAYFPNTYLGVGALFRGSSNGDENTRVYGGQLVLRPTEPLQLALVIGGAAVNNAGDATGTSFAYGGKLGYDFRLGATPFTVGPEADVLFFKPGESTITDYNLLATFKIWI